MTLPRCTAYVVCSTTTAVGQGVGVGGALLVDAQPGSNKRSNARKEPMVKSPNRIRIIGQYNLQRVLGHARPAWSRQSHVRRGDRLLENGCRLLQPLNTTHIAYIATNWMGRNSRHCMSVGDFCKLVVHVPKPWVDRKNGVVMPRTSPLAYFSGVVASPRAAM